MKRNLRILVSVTILILLISVWAYAGIIKSDVAAQWAKEAGAGKTSFSFIVFGDNRPTSPARPMPEVVKVMMKEIGYYHPDFVINTGDMIVGYTDTVEQAREELLGFIKEYYKYAEDVPMVVVPGNHEIRPGDIVEAYRPLFGKKLYYDFTYGNSHFIMVNTNFPGKWLEKDQKYGFYNINDGEHKLAMADWFKEALKVKANHTFIVQHVPLFSALTPNFGKHPKSFKTKENRDEELNLIMGADVDAVFSGHEHIVYVEKHGDTFFFTLGGGGAPLYGTTTGGYNINTGEGPDYAKLTYDPAFENGGRAKGYHYDLHLPAGGFSIFSYMLVTVNGDKVSYELLIPHNMEVTYVKGNDGISPEAVATVANRTPFKRTYRGIKFLMPYSEAGYEVVGTQIDWGRKESVVSEDIAPKILEVKKINDYQAVVRVAVTVPGAFSIDVHVKAK